MISQLTSILGGSAASPAAGRTEAAVRLVTRKRLTQETIEEALAQIVSLLEKHAEGLRSEEIRTNLGMDKKLFQYAAHLGKTSDQLTQSGERRTTVYSVPTKQPVKPAAPKSEAHARVIRRKKKG